MTAAQGISFAGLHPATLPLAMLPLIRSRAAHQSCRQPCNQLPFPRVFPSYSQQTNGCGHTARRQVAGLFALENTPDVRLAAKVFLGAL